VRVAKVAREQTAAELIHKATQLMDKLDQEVVVAQKALTPVQVFCGWTISPQSAEQGRIHLDNASSGATDIGPDVEEAIRLDPVNQKKAAADLQQRLHARNQTILDLRKVAPRLIRCPVMMPQLGH
jgi:hypothetical protein